jgi:hypothetical protein
VPERSGGPEGLLIKVINTNASDKCPQGPGGTATIRRATKKVKTTAESKAICMVGPYIECGRATIKMAPKIAPGAVI